MYYFLLGAIIIVDQLVKFAVDSNMILGQSIPVIENIFHITYIHNTGAAFSFMSGHTVLLSILTGIVLLGLFAYMIVKIPNSAKLEKASISMIIAGGLGNLLDRIIRGYVVDMFDFRIWPIFNIADIAICVGCGLLVLYVLILEPRKRKH